MTIVRTDLDLDAIRFASGPHPEGDEGCVMEWVSYLAGEPWSDHPACVSPAIAAFCRSWNDALNDPPRTELLKPFLTRVIGTDTGREDDQTRAFMAADWFVRTFTPAWLRKAGLNKDAASLETFDELTSTELVDAALPTIQKAQRSADAVWGVAWDATWGAAWGAARDAARDAAWDAARDATRDAAWGAARDAARDAARAAARDATRAAAWDAARDAAWDAAWDATRAAAWGAARGAARDAARAAARDAARDAARAAAWGAARAAARDATRAALADTVTDLQASAQDLLSRMCDVGRASLGEAV